MARGFTIRLGALLGDDPRDYAEFVRSGLRSLIIANVWAYRHDPTLPSVYDAGCVYRREAPGNEQFCDVRTVLERGFGDCEDLACGVASWRIVRTGELARPQITWTRLPTGRYLYHITVLRADGTTEDPSRELGMGNEPGEYVPRGAFYVYQLFPGRSGLVPPPVPIERVSA
ncbi:MAG TPA: hypothetical protein VFQ35_05940 [Polyangiaceae bacterium]|nr:hypothetical protein [Polyangiaceae bacterium]